MSRDIALELIDQIHKRREKGLETYGVPVNPEAESVVFWLKMSIEEGIDAVQYQMAALECVEKMQLCLNELAEVKERLKGGG